MKVIVLLLLCAVLCTACDDTRVFENNYDFDGQSWRVKDQPVFEFSIADTVQSYNIYGYVRNSVSYPYSRLFFTYYLQDSANKELQKKLIQQLLFDPKTGKPEGSSGLGDIYTHEIPLLSNHKFPAAGTYKIKFEQFMRTDTLQGVLSIGARVEKTSE
jgi:gliding motility-associated lipoprotein GldH